MTAIDISSDAVHVQAATATDELQFYSIVDGSRVSIPAVTRDTEWATVTVPFGWCVQGCWDSKGHVEEETALEAAEKTPRFLRTEWRSDINSLPGVSSVHLSPNGRLLAKGCFDGTVAVYNYPTQVAGMRMIAAPGHGSRIAKVRFTCDGKHLVALGQFNRTITVYRISQIEADQPKVP